MLEATERRRSAAVRARGLATALCAAAMLAACGSDGGQSSPDAGTAGSSAAETASAERELVARGEILSFACRPCHGLAPGDESPMGPHLYGVFGRQAAQLPAFDYSPALRESGIVWTAETLDAWLAQPETFVPGNGMAFAGFRSADDRRALIAYLRERTAETAPADEAPGGPLPAAANETSD